MLHLARYTTDGIYGSVTRYIVAGQLRSIVQHHVELLPVLSAHTMSRKRMYSRSPPSIATDAKSTHQTQDEQSQLETPETQVDTAKVPATL